MVPPQEPIVFHNDFSRRNVLPNANVINPTKVPLRVSKDVRDSLKLSAGEQCDGALGGVFLFDYKLVAAVGLEPTTYGL